MLRVSSSSPRRSTPIIFTTHDKGRGSFFSSYCSHLIFFNMALALLKSKMVSIARWGFDLGALEFWDSAWDNMVIHTRGSDRLATF